MQQSTQQPDTAATVLAEPSTTHATRFCPQAVLAAIGQYVQQRDLLAPLREQVQIAQKCIKYTPVQKLTSALVLLLMGGSRLVEINTRLRCEAGLLHAFGLDACAEQSVIQDTLDACDATNVDQMQSVCDLLYRQHSQGYAHDYAANWQLLDIDLSGRPCGRLAEGARKGYFSGKRNVRGRQEGRVYASLYDEIVCQRLYEGNVLTLQAFVPLLEATQQTLQLTPEQRARTIIRADAGAGAMDEVNACLTQGFAFHGKDYSDQRVQSLVDKVAIWYDDPRTPGRQVGLVEVNDPRYVRPLTRVMVQARRKNGTWAQDLILSTLAPQEVLALTGQAQDNETDPAAVLLAYAYFYDARGGGVECGFRQDKQALGLCQRNKKRFAAQQVLDCLCVIAHNLLIWAKNWLQDDVPTLKPYGLKRLMRDVNQIAGQLTFDTPTRVCRLVLNVAHPWARKLQPALTKLLAQWHTDVCLGEI